MKIKVKYAKLGRERINGQAHLDDNIILIDERLKGKKLLEILIHEASHCLFPELEEDEIEKKSIILTNILWKEGFRKIDDDNSIPLQDGTK